MKTKQMLWAAAGLMTAGLMVLASCSNNDSSPSGIKIDPSSWDMSVGETKDFNVSGNDGDVTWSQTISPESAATVTTDGTKATVTAKAAGTVQLVAKDSKGNTATANVTITDAIEVPDLPNPGQGKVTIAVYTEANICDGIYLRGSLDGSSGWGPEGLGDFKAIDGAQGWYSLTLELNDSPFTQGGVETYMAGKPCLRPDASPNWASQWNFDEVKMLENVGTPSKFDFDGDNNILLTDNTGALVYFMVPSFQSTPCEEDVDYTFSITVPDCDQVTAVYMVGSFKSSEWSTFLPMESKGNNVWELTVKGQSGNEWKLSAGEGWGQGEVQVYDAGSETWNNMGNQKFGSSTSVTLNWSDLNNYRWSLCADDPEPENNLIPVSNQTEDTKARD